MNNNSNIQQPTTPQSTSPQSVILITDSAQSAAGQSVILITDSPQSVQAPQSVPPQNRTVAPRTQAVPGLSEAAQWAINPDDVQSDNVVEMPGAAITRGNLRRLLNGQAKPDDMYLDDEVIHFYFARLMQRSATHPSLPKIYCFSSHFLSSTMSWGRSVKLFEMDIVFFPIHLASSKHWALIVVEPKHKQVVYYDSLHRNGTYLMKKIRNFFKARFQKQTGNTSADSEWTLLNEPNVPQQTNGIDCGVFVCQMAERLSRRSPFDFTQQQMPTIRIQMLEQIVAGPFQLPPSNEANEPSTSSVTLPPNQEEAPSARLGRFDMTPTDRMQQLEKELRELRAKFAIQEVELSRIQAAATEQLDSAVSAIREQTDGENQRLKSELAEANRRIEEMEAVKCQSEQPDSHQPDSVQSDSPAPMFEEFPDDQQNQSSVNQTPQSMASDSELESPYWPHIHSPPDAAMQGRSALPRDRKSKARRRLFSDDHPDDDDEPPTRCMRFDTASPDSFVPPYSPPHYRTPTPPPLSRSPSPAPRSPTPPVPAYESPNNQEADWRLSSTLCMLLAPRNRKRCYPSPRSDETT